MKVKNCHSLAIVNRKANWFVVHSIFHIQKQKYNTESSEIFFHLVDKRKSNSTGKIDRIFNEQKIDRK